MNPIQWLKDNKELANAVFAGIVAVFAIFNAFLWWDQKDELNHQKNIDSANLIWNIGQDQYKDKDYDVIYDKLYNNSSYSLKSDFSCYELEDFISNYDTIGNFYVDGLITEKMAYDEFSDDIETAYCNNDIRSCIDSLNNNYDLKSSDHHSFYYGFATLAEALLKSDGQSCSEFRELNR